MSEKLSNEPSKLVLDTYSTIEQTNYKNGATHVYGVDPETGKKKHLSHEDILNAYGHTSQERKDYNTEYEQSILEAEEDDLDAQEELDEEWADLQQIFIEARQNGSLQDMQHALDMYKSFIGQFEVIGEVEQNAMLAELLNKEFPNKFELGDSVRVQHTSGVIEDGWTVEEIINNDEGVVYKVSRPANDGTNDRLVKRIQESELVNVNSKERAADTQVADSGRESDSATSIVADSSDGDKVPGGTFDSVQVDTSDQEDEQTTMQKVKEVPTKLFLVAKAKLAEMSNSWKELPEKNKKRYKLLGGIAAGALVVAGTYMAMRGFDSGGTDQVIGVDNSVSPDAAPSDASLSATPELSSETTNPSVVQGSVQPTPEASSLGDVSPSMQSSPEVTTTTGGSGGGTDMATPTGIESTPDSSNLTSVQEKFAESKANYPWDAAHNTYGDRAGSALQEAVKKAQEAGLDVDTFGEGKEWKIRVNGSWNTKDVVKVLAEYMPKR
ncbi:hypothetical protein KC871_02600 [Candidatus Saccharibacteria bacterium]|nr:hypothetical protein [Candidatus Saccharibacteria bacterium]MCB9817353.1 hypothetical protein [Candidatus Nomurabacteria bacterium]